MTQRIDAIFDNGVLRPLVPLHLPDQSIVKVTVETAVDPISPDKLAAQKAALQALWQEIDQLPQHCNNDGWSVRQHDELLYGKK
jgi:predicted DNA-binding antitoxin AbrB/MazE fold protein